MYIHLDNRKLQRVNLSGAVALFVDSGSYYKGELKDVSYNGFRVNFPSINSLPIFWPDLTVFFSTAIWRLRKFRIIICTNITGGNDSTGSFANRTGKSFLVSAYPRWMVKKENRLEVGFRIPVTSVGWQFFVHHNIVENE